MSVLASLRHRDFRMVAAGFLASLLGDGVFRVSIALQVYAVDRDPRSFAAVALVWTLSQVLLLPVGGWATDRFPRRTIIVAADLWRAAAIGALGVLSLAGELTIPYLLVIAACFGAGNAFFNPAAISFIPDLLPEEELGRANAFLGAARPVMLYIVGPLLGAVVLSGGAPGAAFVLDAVSFLVSAALVAAVAPRHVQLGEAEGIAAQLREALQGLALVRTTRWLWLGMLGISASTFAFNGPFESLVPFVLIDDFGYDAGEAGFALAPILAASGVGAIVTMWWIGRHDLPRRSALAYYWGEGVALLALVVFGLMTSPWQGVIAGAVIGAMFALTETVWTTNLQRWVPRDRLGRVSSLDWMIGIGLIPLGFLVTGQLAVAFGARTVLVAAGLIGAAVLFALALVPGARDVERLGEPKAPESEPVLTG
jgi:MFS family permease